MTWERTPRIKPEKLTIASTGTQIASVMQRDISDHYRGAGVEEIKQRLQLFKETLDE